MSQGLYLYGIVDCPQVVDLGSIGIGDPPAAVRTFPAAGSAALVSAVADAEVLPLRRDLLAHQRVLDLAMERWTVLPVGFGTISASPADLERLLVQQSSAFQSTLAEMQGLVEVGIKAFWSREALLAELCQQHPQINELLRRSAAGEAGREEALTVGQQVESLVAEWRDRYTEEICRRFAPLTRGHRVGEPIGVKMLFNVSFLIERTRVGAFEGLLAEVDQAYTPGLDFKYVRPMAPYNFVSLRIELPAAEVSA